MTDFPSGKYQIEAIAHTHTRARIAASLHIPSCRGRSRETLRQTALSKGWKSRGETVGRYRRQSVRLLRHIISIDLRFHSQQYRLHTRLFFSGVCLQPFSSLIILFFFICRYSRARFHLEAIDYSCVIFYPREPFPFPFFSCGSATYRVVSRIRCLKTSGKDRYAPPHDGKQRITITCVKANDGQVASNIAFYVRVSVARRFAVHVPGVPNDRRCEAVWFRTSEISLRVKIAGNSPRDI